VRRPDREKAHEQPPSAALREFIEYIKGQSNVWFPTREQIASWYLGEAGLHMSRKA
jgi:hypothetical protein